MAAVTGTGSVLSGADRRHQTSHAATRAATPPPSGVSRTYHEGAPPKPTGKLAGVSKDVLRKGFVRKVYGIVAAELVVTALVALACIQIPQVHRTMSGVALRGWYRLAVLIPTMVCLFGLQWRGKIFPWNYCFLLGFTLCISTNVGFICVHVVDADLAPLLVQAVGLTGAIFLLLSVFTLRSERDFTFLRSYLPASLCALLIGSLVGWLFGLSFVDGLIAWAGAIVFCGYIVFDTYMLANKLDYDEYIRGAAELYLDIINLFIRILQILLQQEKNTKKNKK
jgi:hypothetical protein